MVCYSVKHYFDANITIKQKYLYACMEHTVELSTIQLCDVRVHHFNLQQICGKHSTLATSTCRTTIIGNCAVYAEAGLSNWFCPCVYPS